ncbi:MAG TPA: DUF3068 domain-containing protein [Micromonosporaceae bacterium]|nr:DUF3068 domain-containing protein [Micromonosporaceae bacterium]
MRRFVGAVLIGFGVLFLVVAVGLPLYVAPAVTKLPYDLEVCPDNQTEGGDPPGCLRPSVAEASGATFLEIGTLKVQTGTLRSTTWVRPQPKATADWQRSGKLDDDAFIWDVYSDAKWADGGGAVVSAYSTSIAIDRVSGAAVDWDGQWLDDSNLGKTVAMGNVKYEGQVYKFPFGTEKKDYLIYDRDIRKAVPATFVDVATVDGVEAYHFRQEIKNLPVQNVTPATLTALLGVFAKTATSGKILYSNTREVWVDPVTGAYLDVREQPRKELVPDDGTDGPTVLLNADFRYTPETVANSVSSAKSNQSQLKLVTLYGPIGFGVLALIFLGLGVLLAVRGPSAATEPGPWDAALPKPRHRLRDDGSGLGNDTGPLSDTIPGSTPTWSGPEQR